MTGLPRSHSYHKNRLFGVVRFPEDGLHQGAFRIERPLVVLSRASVQRASSSPAAMPTTS